MSRYRDIPINQRVDKIGELLAKGIYLYLKKENRKEVGNNTLTKEGQSSNINLDNHNASVPSFSEGETKK